jgi:hypothetical protein
LQIMNTAQIVHKQAGKRTVSLGEAQAAAPLTVQQVLGQVALIQQIMKAAMKEGEHFGRIPGCGNKPSLLKPGAEKLCLTFRLAPSYDVEERQLECGHREYRITATLTSILSGALVGQGVGSCSTLENKYRFRTGAAEVTERAVPRAYWDIRQDDPAKAQELIGGVGFTVKKVDGQGWMVAKGGEKVETDNPADSYNTVLKMGKKRALVDAVLTATAASDIFTQDLEDISANLATITPAIAPDASPDAAKAGPTLVPSLPNTAEPAPVPQPETVQVEPMDFRLTPIHFGKNRGFTLAELSPQQLHWYEKEWMVKKEAEGAATQGDLTLINGLKAYRNWREAEKAQNPRKP